MKLIRVLDLNEDKFLAIGVKIRELCRARLPGVHRSQVVHRNTIKGDFVRTHEDDEILVARADAKNFRISQLDIDMTKLTAAYI